jgi:retron-type reverse transcriptase
LDIIGQDIHDPRFLKLLKGILKAGYMEEWIYHETYSGVPQGGVISPILSNIILNKLDEFVANELIPQYTKGKQRRLNPEYRRLSRKMAKARQVKDIETYRQLQTQRRHIPSGKPNDKNFRRLRYIRYADDFALGFIGPKSEALEIKAKISVFLTTLKLTLSAEKTLITHAVEGRARFLGYCTQQQSHYTKSDRQQKENTRSQWQSNVKRASRNCYSVANAVYPKRQSYT